MMHHKIINNKKLKWLVTIFFVITLSACGTMERHKSEKSVYKGVDMDLTHLGTPSMWLGSLLIIPLMMTLSLPADAVVDTLYYPFDKWEYDKKMAPELNYKAQVDTVSVLGVNLSGKTSFRYQLSNKKQGFKSTVVDDYAFDTSNLVNVKNLQTMDIYKTKTSDFGLIFEWQEKQIIRSNAASQSNYEEEQYFRVMRDVMPPEVSANKNLLLALFMPCSQVMLLPVESMPLTEDNILQQIKQSPDIINKLNQLRHQQANNQCPAN